MTPAETTPLVLRVEATSPELAARAAYFLAKTTGGSISPSADAAFLRPDVYRDRLGDFDLEAAMARIR